jgi:hypothetical protein
VVAPVDGFRGIETLGGMDAMLVTKFVPLSRQTGPIHQCEWHSITTKRERDMTVTFVTGANKGLGYETARQLIERGHTVYIGARSVERGEAAATELGGQFVQLDVTDDASAEAALPRTRPSTSGGLGPLAEPARVTPLVPSRDAP